MKKRSKIHRTAAAFLLAAAVAAGSGTVFADPQEEADDGGWGNWGEEENDPTVSPEREPVTVGENANYALIYDAAGADIYVTDKRSGHVWSNTVTDVPEQNMAAAHLLSQLLQIGVCDESGSVSTLQVYDGRTQNSELAVDYAVADGTLTLSVAIPAHDISLQVCFSLAEDGLCVRIPADGVRQEGGSRLVSVAVMPYFGAARIDRSGYLLVPDGSGALVEFDGREEKEQRVYTLPVYGQTQQDYTVLTDARRQGIANVMLPVYGIRSDTDGFLAGVTARAENASVSIVPSGFQVARLARAYFTFHYLYTETVTVNGREITRMMPLQETGDREVRYFLLDRAACDYSDMAAAWRRQLIADGVLTERDTQMAPLLSLDVVMGVQKSGMFFDTLVKMTTFAQAGEIAQALADGGTPAAEITLKGWNEGGITALPTPYSPASALGGKRGLSALAEQLTQNGTALYLWSDPVSCDADSGTVNLRRDVLRDYVGNMIGSTDSSALLLNVTATLQKRLDNGRAAGCYDKAAFSLGQVGQLLWNSFERGQESTRADTRAAVEQALADAVSREGRVQVQGGSQYVLPYAASLRDIPDGCSGYYYETCSVPFYQLVVSGCADYTSAAGNTVADLTEQVLRWAEYGCTPYFIVTQESTRQLVGSSYTELFSSEYAVWSDRICDVCRTFAERLGAARQSPMTAHRRIGDSAACVTYQNGWRVYVNYADEALDVDGVTVGARDHLAVAPEGGAG